MTAGVDVYSLGGGLITLDVARLSAGRPLTQVEWANEVASGWPGPNGSSYSTDSIFGVRTGRTGSGHSTLPADVHDAWYRVLRRLHATTAVGSDEVEALRERVDGAFFAQLLSLADLAPFGLRTLFRARCFLRWRAVRRLGGLVNRPDLDQERFLPVLRPDWADL